MPEARTVLVTGGSRGLGLAICRTLAADGFRVVAVARRSTPELEAAVADATAGSIHFVAADLAELDTLGALVASAGREHGPIRGLVNNAGVSVEGTLAMTKIVDMERVVRLNTLAPMVLTRHVVRSMMAEGGGPDADGVRDVGRIVNISSITASVGYSGLAVYSATKASLEGFTRSLAREVGRLGITVNAVAPGFVDTEMTAGMTAEAREQIARRSAMKRLVAAEDVAGTVAFLLSDRARSMTGTVLTIDAGSTA